MMIRLLIALLACTACANAGAEAYSANVGVDWTAARATAGTTAARANGRFGLQTRWAVTDRGEFETGTDYVFRRIQWTRADRVRTHVDFDYVDVPATYRYRVTDRWRAFAGVRLGINVLDKVEVDSNTPAVDPRAHAMIGLGEVGLRGQLNPDFALDLAFERQLGDFARDLREYRALTLKLIVSL